MLIFFNYGKISQALVHSKKTFFEQKFTGISLQLYVVIKKVNKGLIYQGREIK